MVSAVRVSRSQRPFFLFVGGRHKPQSPKCPRRSLTLPALAASGPRMPSGMTRLLEPSQTRTFKFIFCPVYDLAKGAPAGPYLKRSLLRLSVPTQLESCMAARERRRRSALSACAVAAEFRGSPAPTTPSRISEPDRTRNGEVGLEGGSAGWTRIHRSAGLNPSWTPALGR